MSYSERILEYCELVLVDGLPNRKCCLFEKQAVQRHLDDLKRQDDPEFEYYFSEAAANRRCGFTENLQHTKGKWRGDFIKLEGFQVFEQGVLFGWLRKKNGMRRFNKAYVEVPRKNGKALEIDTPVFTTFGWQKHGDLRVGDSVFGPDGKPIKVLAVTEHYEGMCYEIGFADGEEIVAHEFHEWSTNRTWFTKRVRGVHGQCELPLVETWELAETLKMTGTREDYVHSVNLNKAIVLPQIQLPIDPYVLGVWLGDGSSGSPQFTSEDLEIVEKVNNVFPVREMKSGVSKGNAKLYSLSDGDGRGKHTFWQKLKAMNLVKNKHIPGLFFMASIEQRYELLRGVLDTDGTISKAGQISLTLTNKRLIEDVETLVKSLGLKTMLKEARATLYGKDCGPKYLLHFFPQDNTPLFCLARKLIRQKPVPEGKNRRDTKTVSSAILVGNRTVNCITVEGGLYLAGKSFTITHNSIDVATTGLYMGFADGEQGAEVYSGAQTEAQAMCTFEPAHAMVRQNPQLAEYYGLKLTGTPRNPTSIYRESDMSRFLPIVGKPGDGASPHCALIDEFHEALTTVLYDAMDTGQGARDQPLIIVVTTAGVNIASPCYELHLEAVKILNGSLTKDNTFVMLFGLDPDDKWEDWEVWKKVNPNYMVSINEDYLKGKYSDALNNLSQRAILLTKHLNLWQNVGMAFVDMQRWAKCEDKELKLEDFKGQECWVSLDLASKIDLAATVFMFKYVRKVINTNCPKCYGETTVRDGINVCVSGTKLENEEICAWQKPVVRNCVVAFTKHYLPEETVNKKENQHYRTWEKQGHLISTEGARTDFQRIEDDIEEMSKSLIIKELAFDPKEASYLIQNIQKWANFECVEFSQNPATISEPMKEFEAMVQAGEFWHSGDPVFTWCVGNVVKKQSRSGGAVKSYFPTKEVVSNKIDSAVAAIMALGRLMTYDSDGESVYDRRTASGEETILRVL